MILVLGGTTEGRKAVEVLEEAGKPFFYSTKTGEQNVLLHHGVAVSGAMDVPQMVAFFRERDIHLIVDAAHPFAEQLHSNILSAARQSGIPAIRYDRIYPPHDPDLIWCRDYADAVCQLEAHHIQRLLALTGVNTIGKLKPYWQHHQACWFRILNRQVSQDIARRHQFPAEHLVFYESDDTATLIRDLQPEAIITKESGLSGGFTEKIDAARSAGVKVFVVERPKENEEWRMKNGEWSACVNGPHGLRRAIEQLLPGFFPLRTGLTTGTCATAAAVAATMRLLDGDAPAAVSVHLPDGETVSVPVGFSDAFPSPPSTSALSPPSSTSSPLPPSATAFCIKDFSDDPDVTRGARITVRVAIATDRATGIRFLQGEGVGRVTLPGLGIPIGEPAINPTPRRCITEALAALTSAPLDITISVEGGRELALKTFNPRVGVVDGISIIGTSGIVTPLSNDAFVESIGREMEVACAMGCTAIGLASGKRGEEALLAAEPSLRVIHYGNFIGAALEKAHALGFQRAVLGIMIGKAVKLAEGHLDTHSHKVTMNPAFLIDVATQAGIADASTRLANLKMARDLWQLMPPPFFDAIRDRCLHHCRTVFPTGTLEIQIIESEQ